GPEPSRHRARSLGGAVGRDPTAQRAGHFDRDAQLAPASLAHPEPDLRGRQGQRSPGRARGRQGARAVIVVRTSPFISPDDLHLLNEGTHRRLYERLGAHPTVLGDTAGTAFAVWAPNAERVGVVGDFSGWDDSATQLAAMESSGVWSGFIPGVG